MFLEVVLGSVLLSFSINPQRLHDMGLETFSWNAAKKRLTNLENHRFSG